MIFAHTHAHSGTHAAIALAQGDSDRVVLLINFWHPELAQHEKRLDLNTFGYDPI